MGRLSKRTIQCRLARKQRDQTATQALGVHVEPLVQHHHHHHERQQGQQQEQQARRQQLAQQQQQPPQQQAQPTGSSSSRSSSRSSLTSLKVMQPCATGLDFSKLGPESLRRYQQAYGLDLDACSSSEEAAWAVAHHFAEQGPLDEGKVLLRFAAAVRREAAGCQDSA